LLTSQNKLILVQILQTKQLNLVNLLILLENYGPQLDQKNIRLKVTLMVKTIPSAIYLLINQMVMALACLAISAMVTQFPM
jgi:hypothetical protein